MNGELERLASDFSVRALGQQEEVLKELRSRTGILLAASSVTASFLGAQAIDRDGFGVVTILALLAFIASILASVYVLLPKSELIFALQGPVLYERLYEHRDNPDEMHRLLAYWVASFREQNQGKIDRLFRFYEAAAFALVVQIVLWALVLSDELT